MIPGISENKAEIWSYSVLASWRDSGRSTSSFSGALPRRKADEKIFRVGSFNKRCSFSIWSLDAAMLLLAGRGGEDKKQNGVILFSSRGSWGKSKLQPGVDYMAALFCCHDPGLIWQPLLMPMVASFQPPWWRPFQGFIAASIALSFPSGLVPGDGEGGRRWSPQLWWRRRTGLLFPFLYEGP